MLKRPTFHARFEEKFTFEQEAVRISGTRVLCNNLQYSTKFEKMLSRVLLATDGVWIGNWIYEPLQIIITLLMISTLQITQQYSQSISTSLYVVTALYNG
jgi:hypothetical protein